MHPILFQIGPLKIYSYGVCLASGFIIAALLARAEARRQNVSPEKILDIALSALLAGILGARAFYVAQNLSYYASFPAEILMLHKGGLSFYGGFISAVFWVIIALKRAGLPLFKTLDIYAPYIALAQAIGRIGCFLNGCCYGKETTCRWAVSIPADTLSRHPVQLYESLSLLLIFLFLRILQEKRRFSNKSANIFLFYCILYSILRFSLEFLRADNAPVIGSLTIHHFISAGIFTISILPLLWQRAR